ncbi:MAG: formylmethanofuran dehydrogenase subunit C [Gammaproteobacteria bacterium]|nr:formylmethanofuran dehydrogenase subunit C [Gammaproteobacteria bacterium]
MTVSLVQIQPTRQRLDCRGLLPARLAQMSITEIQRLPLRAGNRRIPLAELFTVEHDQDGVTALNLKTLDNHLDYLGADLAEGRMEIVGDAGDFAGRAMLGGELLVHGDCADYAGSGLSGGTLSIRGNAGHCVGGPGAGERQGQRGGVIHLRGNAGERAGERMRRGKLIIEGDVGRLLGYRMIAGTIYAAGRVAERAGYDMRRGTLLLNQLPHSISPTLRANGRHTLPFLHLLIEDLQQSADGRLKLPPSPTSVTRFLGDTAAGGRGEMLIIS